MDLSELLSELKPVRRFGNSAVKISKSDLEAVSLEFRRAIGESYSRTTDSYEHESGKMDWYMNGMNDGPLLAEEIFRELYLAACLRRSVDLEHFNSRIPQWKERLP